MELEEIKKRFKELGIIYTDASSKESLEDVIRIVEETDKDPKMVGAMLAVDGETDRKYFNTREKILAFLDSKGLDIDGKIKAMQAAQGADKTFYTNVKTKEQQLESEIAMYLTYAWVEYK